MGLGNPRPPLFSWYIAVPGIVLSPLIGDVWQSVITVLILSTAIWGALTVFPTYFLTKNIFGKRAGLIAAFLMAVMPAHLQRSQATDADHDSMVLFFVVTSFYFFMKALKTLYERRWVASWNIVTKEGRYSIFTGIKDFFKENPKSILYSVMAGISMGTVALIWQGWTYVPIILLIYVVLQLFVDRFRNRDPMGMGICFTITMGAALLLAAPWYVIFGQIKVWYDVPLILFLVASVLGVTLTVTRNYPWILVIPSVLITGGVILTIMIIISPAIASAFVSGAGYFVRTKLYETIAEAQAPGISQAILSFGAATYYLSLFGLFWMAVKLPKRLEPDYLFILTWTFAAIFMSMAAARFIFNASPAFALTAGWVIALLVEKLDFETMKKTFSSLSGGSKLNAFRKSVKPKHIIGTLLIIFILLLPNVWHGVDASIPYEQKAVYDRQVYYTMPEFMRPQGYTPPTGRGGSTFYFGMFGYSLPLTNGYFPASWEWFSTQDTELPELERPAYLSWWDYGFEAVDRGAHPTVADNFQDGYQLAGQFITAQNEDTAIALLILRLLDGDFYGNKGHLSDSVSATLQKYSIDPSKVANAYQNPSSLIQIVLNNPIKYGRWDSRMQPMNALYIYLRQYLDAQTTTDTLASLYHDMRKATGWSIRYFSVDSRMFPFDGGGNNIYYAPVKLSDHRVLELNDGRVIPIDFFTVEAETDKGTFPVDQVPLDAQVNQYNIKYTEMFYNSMFYRAYLGFGPNDLNQACSTEDCLPGIRGDLSSMMPMQGWNLSHFKAVYKTAYYNSWPISEYQNHSDDWRAINYYDALDYQRQINRNQMQGVIDFSNQTLARSGLVYLKYYDGAYINGTVTVDGINPIPGVRVTVQDYEDPSNPTPHYSVFTDENGRYSLLAPFGSIRIVTSTGTLNQRLQTGSTILNQEFLYISDEQAMRKDIDRDGDGLPDYEIRLDITVDGVTIIGHAFLDFDGDKNQTYGEELLTNTSISFKHENLNVIRNVTTNSEGTFLLEHVYEGKYMPTITYRGRTFTSNPLTVGKTASEENLPINTYRLEGTVLLPGNITAVGAIVTAFDENWGQTAISQTNEQGFYEFYLLQGNFTISATSGHNTSIPRKVYIGSLQTTVVNITTTPSGQVSGITSIVGLKQGQVLLNFEKIGSSLISYSTISDASALYNVQLPIGTYDITAKHYKDGTLYAFIGRTTIQQGKTTNYNPNLSEGVKVHGVTYSIDKTKGAIGLLNITFYNGQGILRGKSSIEGRYSVYIPKGDCVIQAGYFNLTYFKKEYFDVDSEYDVSLEVGTLIRATIYYDKNRNNFVEPDEGVADAKVAFLDSYGNPAETFTDSEGRYQITIPSKKIYEIRINKEGFQTLIIGPGTLQSLGAKFTSSLTPLNITTSGHLFMKNPQSPGRSIQISFVSLGEGAISSSTISDSSGKYSIDLAPGEYEIVVDEPLIQGINEVKYQNVKTEILVLGLGVDSVTKDLDLFIRSSVIGDVYLYGTPKNASLVFQGPETMNLIAKNGNFSLMLAQGNYTVYANFTEGGTVYAKFEVLNLLNPQYMQIALTRATIVEGSLMYEGSRLMEVAPISFTSEEEAIFEKLTSSEGSYRADLVPGTYKITVNYRGNTTIKSILRYVRYTHTSTLVIPTGKVFLSYDILLERTLDNSTIKGRVEFKGLPVMATLEFRPDNPEGINATATAASDGSYSIQLAPGLYIMYVHDLTTHGVSLQSIEVTPHSTTYLNISLEQGYKVSGVTTYLSNVRIPSMIIYSISFPWEVYTDKTGYYEVYLPSRRYSLMVFTIIQEHGLNVGYNHTAFLNVDADIAGNNYHLERIPRREVFLSLDESRSQNRPVAPGSTIEKWIIVWNSGSIPDSYLLEGATVGWDIEFDREIVFVDFGTIDGVLVNQTYVKATINAPYDAKVEHPTIGIIATSLNVSLERYILNVDITVQRSRGVTLSTSGVIPAFDGKFLNYTLEIINVGNGREHVGVQIYNIQDIKNLGWHAAIRANSTALMRDLVEGIIVEANSTTPVTLVMENTGGGQGVGVLVVAYLQDDRSYESDLIIYTGLPELQLEGWLVQE